MSLFSALFGRPLRTSESHAQRIRPMAGVAVLGLDALASASYGPEAALTILLPLGTPGLRYVPWVLLAILVLLGILYFSYRQTIDAYPNGGGSYTVARENLGARPGLFAAAALLLDYVLNVAVGISAGVGAMESAFPALHAHRLEMCLGVLLLVTIVNLRGVRESGAAWIVPVYVFIISLVGILAVGVWKTLTGESQLNPTDSPQSLDSTFAPAGAWMVMRAFASGCTAMTGVEAVGNAVPIFTPPSSQNARRTLAIICGTLALLLSGIGYLAHALGVGATTPGAPGYQSVISQLVAAIAGRGTIYYITMGSVLAVLTLSANTSFAAFPRLCRQLAEDGYLPGPFATVGRRLVHTLGICILTIAAGLLLVIFHGVTDHLIPLFAVGAFSAFTLSQLGMIAHWRREGSAPARASIGINLLGAASTSVSLVVILIAKFTDGAWISLVVIGGTVFVLENVHRYYARIARETEPPAVLQTWKLQQLRVVIPFKEWDRVSERALRFALQISDDVTAVHISENETKPELIDLWRARIENPAAAAGYPRPRLKIVHSPYRAFFQPLLDYLDEQRKEDAERLIAVVIPELVQPRWWEYFLHNYVPGLLKALLLLHGDEKIVVINTPWYLRPRPPD